MIDINLNGVWRTFRAAIPHVAEQHGHLLALSSMIGFVHPPLGMFELSKVTRDGFPGTTISSPATRRSPGAR